MWSRVISFLAVILALSLVAMSLPVYAASVASTDDATTTDTAADTSGSGAGTGAGSGAGATANDGAESESGAAPTGEQDASTATDPSADTATDLGTSSTGSRSNTAGSDQAFAQPSPSGQLYNPRSLDTLAATPVALESYEIEISTFAELRDILTQSSYNNISIIYLKDNLVFPGYSYYCNPAHVDFTVVGHPKGDDSLRYIIRDHAGAYFYAGKSGRHITIKDAIIYGYNYYGTFDFDGYTNGIYEFINVEYIGSQAALMGEGGTMVLRDSNVTIESPPNNTLDPTTIAQDPRQEAFETSSYDFYGNCTVRKLSGDLSQICFRFGTNRHLTVHTGANVRIEGRSTQSAYGVFYIDGTGVNAPQIHVEDNAAISVYARQITQEQGHNFNLVSVGINASLVLEQYECNRDAPLLSMRGNIHLGANSTFDLRRPNNGYYNGLIHSVTSGNGIIMQDPKRLLLIDPGRAPITTSGASFALSGSVGAINTWTGTNTAGDIANRPTQAWNKQDGSSMQLSAAIYDNYTSQASISGLTADDYASATFSTNSFALQNMSMLSMGSYHFSIDEVSAQSTVLGGSADPGTALLFDYVNAGSDQLYGCQATAGGSYISNIPDAPIEQGVVININAYHNYLHYRHRTTVVGIPVLENLTLNVPQYIDFGFVSNPSVVWTFDRSDELVAQIVDSRRVHTPWSLQVSVAEVLSGSAGTVTYTLPNSLVFVDDTWQTSTLSDVPLEVYAGTTDSSGETIVTWSIDSGILLLIAPGEAMAEVPYTGKVQWTLSTGP